MKLSEYLDIDNLMSHVRKGIVNARRHNTLPLTIYSYSRKAVYGKIWDDVTKKTRGLIVADDETIIARPYEKFFDLEQTLDYYPEYNLETSAAEIVFNNAIITEKINGCLGTFWKYGIHWGIATKGSFHSPHAEWATKWMENHIHEHGKLIFPEGYTPVFEIVSEEVQPHTIKYTRDELFLLDFINMETGEELNRKELLDYSFKNNLLGPIRYPLSFQEALVDDSNEIEGYVATFNRSGTTPIKIKIKFPTFWANRKKFYAVQDPKTQQAVNDQKTAAEIVLEALKVCTTRKEFAEYFNKDEHKQYASICFNILDYEAQETTKGSVL